MSVNTKTKTISFRVSTDEYESFYELCVTHGIGSLSELARLGIGLLLQKTNNIPPAGTLEARVNVIEARVRMLATKVDQCIKSVEHNNGRR